MEDEKMCKSQNENIDISNNDVEKLIKEKLFISMNDNQNNHLNTENDEIMSNREKESENKLNELIENHSNFSILFIYKNYLTIKIK